MRQGLIRIHIAVFLFGFAGLFGKFLSCSPFYIVLGRTFFAGLALGFLILVQPQTKLTGFSQKAIAGFIFQGILLACHWVFFFLAIQVSSVSVGLITFSSFPLFVTFMEPVFFKEPLRPFDLATAIAVFAGIILVVPDLDLSNQTTLGACYGILSGLTFAILALVNRKNTNTANAVVLAFYQNCFAALFLIFPIILLNPQPPKISDLPTLVLLGVVFTALAHTCFISALSHIRAQTASVVAGLEPVYGIVFAYFLLNESPGFQTLAGGILIIGASLGAGWFSSKQ